MNFKLVTISIASAAALMAVSPMKLTSMSTDNGGIKSAIDAYSDGAGVLLINQVSESKVDNSTMNRLVFKYGDAAKAANTTLKLQVNSSTTATAQEKSDAVDKLEVAKIIVNPPTTGSSCDDGNVLTINDVWSGSVCTGLIPASCNVIKTTLPASADGTYTIDPDGSAGAASFPVYCDMTTDGGGWTKIGSRIISNGKYSTISTPVDAKEFLGKYTGMIYYNHYGASKHTHQVFDVYLPNVAKIGYASWWNQTLTITNTTASSPIYSYYKECFRMLTSNYEQPTPGYYTNKFAIDVPKGAVIYFGDVKNLSGDYSWDAAGFSGSQAFDIFYR